MVRTDGGGSGSGLNTATSRASSAGFGDMSISRKQCATPLINARAETVGELRRLVAPLEIVREREGEFEGRCVASVAARLIG